jgi:predicted nuclease with TOPRIM domain
MEIPSEILIILLSAIGAFIGGVGLYIKQRLKELDEMRAELTELKVQVAILQTEKEAAIRAARNLTGSRSESANAAKMERIRKEIEEYEAKLKEENGL